MSAGVFTKTRYAASYGGGGNIHPIRVQPETVVASIGGTTNDPPAGAITNPISAVVSNNKRAKGLRPRLVSLKSSSVAGEVPDGYAVNGITTIPALNQAFWDAAVNDDSVVVSYLGVTWSVAGRSIEEVR